MTSFTAPGLVDLQVNGFRGLDFNTMPIAADLTGRAARELWSVGVTTFFPTLITGSPAAIRAGLLAVARACDADPVAAAAVGGIHLEGPFISPEDGPRGAHEKRHVRKPDFGLVAEWKKASGGRLRILTMSPEWPGSAAFIRRCVRAGLTVSIGHTAATPAQIAEAVAAGASMSTHLGNGAHLSLPRHPNYLWEQLSQDRLAACLIADGFHLPASFLKVAMRVKGERALLVSDAVALAGLRPGRHRTPVGGTVVLTREGRLHLASNPALLAGSALPLIEGVRRLAAAGLASREEAWAMGSERPAGAMKLAVHGDRVRVGVRGRSWTVLETWKSGRRVYAART